MIRNLNHDNFPPLKKSKTKQLDKEPSFAKQQSFHSKKLQHVSKKPSAHINGSSFSSLHDDFKSSNAMAETMGHDLKKIKSKQSGRNNTVYTSIG